MARLPCDESLFSYLKVNEQGAFAKIIMRCYCRLGGFMGDTVFAIDLAQ
jgi:hypothetical protein